MRTPNAPHTYRGPIKAAVLDWAGTTVDFGSCAPVLAFMGALGDLGIVIEPEQARGPMGMSKRDHIRALLELPEVRLAWTVLHGRAPDAQAVERVYEAFVPRQQGAIELTSALIPGTLEALAGCAQRAVRVAATTGYGRAQLEALAPRAALQGYRPEFTVCADDVSEGRPAPFMLFEAARRLGVYPMTAVVAVDDTVAGIHAALHAGCWAVGVAATGNLVGLTREAWEGLDEREQRRLRERAQRALLRAGAHYVIESLRDLDVVLDEIARLMEDGLTPAEHPGATVTRSLAEVG